MSLPKNIALLKLDVSYQEHEMLMGAKATNLKNISRNCDVQITVSKYNARNTRYKNNLVKVLGQLDKLPKALKSIRDTNFQVIEIPIYDDCLPLKIDAITRVISEKCKFICCLQQDEERKWLKMKVCKNDSGLIKSSVNFLLNNVSSKERKVLLPIDVTPSKISFLKKKLSASGILDFYSEVSIEYPEDIGNRSVIDLDLKNSTLYIHGPFEHCIKVKEEVQKCLPMELNFDIIRKSSFSTDLIVGLEDKYDIEIIQRDSKRVIVKGAEGELKNLIRVMELLIESAEVECTTSTSNERNILIEPVKFDRTDQFFKRVCELYEDNKEEKHLQGNNEDLQTSYSSIDKSLEHSQTNATKPGSLDSSDNCSEQASSETDSCESAIDFEGILEGVYESTAHKPESSKLKDLTASSKDVNKCSEYPIGVIIALRHVFDEDIDDLICSFLQLV